MLETMRRRVRSLVKLIEKTRRGIVYTDFEDELGELSAASLRGMEIGADLTRFEQKLRIYLRTHEDQLAVQKIRRNRQITATDLEELERIFIESGIGTEAEISVAKETSGGLGLFLRSLVGLDRAAAAAAFGTFQEGKTFTSVQLRFINELVDYLAHNGRIEVDMLYRPPFTPPAGRRLRHDRGARAPAGRPAHHDGGRTWRPPRTPSDRTRSTRSFSPTCTPPGDPTSGEPRRHRHRRRVHAPASARLGCSRPRARRPRSSPSRSSPSAS